MLGDSQRHTAGGGRALLAGRNPAENSALSDRDGLCVLGAAALLGLWRVPRLTGNCCGVPSSHSGVGGVLSTHTFGWIGSFCFGACSSPACLLCPEGRHRMGIVLMPISRKGLGGLCTPNQARAPVSRARDLFLPVPPAPASLVPDPKGFAFCFLCSISEAVVRRPRFVHRQMLCPEPALKTSVNSLPKHKTWKISRQLGFPVLSHSLPLG